MKKIIKYQKLIFSISLIAVVFLYQQNLYSQNKRNDRLPRLLTEYCSDLNINAQLLTDQGCCVKITFNQFWSVKPGSNPNIFDLPHGILIEINSPNATISSSTTGSAWFSGSTMYPDPNDKYIMWSKLPVQSGNTSSTALPSGQDLIITLCINVNQDDPISITVKGLTGWAHTNDSSKWYCRSDPFEFSKPSIPYTITADPESICKGGDGKITLTPPHPPGATVSWYSFTGTPCTGSIPPALPWVEESTNGGDIWYTNPLNSTTCYIAVIDEGCFSYTTDVATVTVCDPNIVGITATGTPITPLDGEQHVCEQGEWTLSLSNITCPSTITWEWWTDCTGAWTTISTGNETNNLSIETGNLIVCYQACATEYQYRAVIENACGTITKSWNIIIDAPTQPGIITANPFGTGTLTAPILCYDRATILTYSGGCGEIVKWNSSTTEVGPWSPIPDAGKSSEYWTNKLTQTTWYSVVVKNGACAEDTSVIKVTVKPLLTVSITSTAFNLCTDPLIITATTSYDGTSHSGDDTYQWFLDAVLISGETNPTINASTNGAGIYYVMVYDLSCKDSAKSNTIKICPVPTAVIVGPTCFCKGDMVTLSGVLVLPIRPKDCSPSPNCTYIWDGPGGPYTGATITVGLAGTYYLQVKCPDGCIAETSIIISYCPVGDCL